MGTRLKRFGKLLAVAAMTGALGGVLLLVTLWLEHN
jgi:hypothetical protein